MINNNNQMLLLFIKKQQITNYVTLEYILNESIKLI